ncbi:MAG: hypothetical protein KDM91_10945 [Verrucomicrobiae bacterium]|nr:hypothetical protein [Verrucomicrobiae bacterium]MCP5538781.1 hypothetical protein [Akkermansiaceae bacterium]
MRKALHPLLAKMALPLATLWVRRQERRILRRGRPLAARERDDARRAGVTEPEAVRVMVVRRVPVPSAGLLGLVARATGFPLFQPAGMALGRGIYLDEAASRSRFILVHELVHIAQYERLGGVPAFLRRYVAECLADGYESAALEREANEVSRRICEG